jgi:hypothetical protein
VNHLNAIVGCNTNTIRSNFEYLFSKLYIGNHAIAGAIAINSTKGVCEKNG